MSNYMGLTAEMTVATGINVMYAVRHNHDPFFVLLGSGLFYGFLLGISEIDAELASMFGLVFLVATIIFHGTDFILILTGLVGQK